MSDGDSGRTELNIARIGLISAVVVAVLGLCGTAITVLGTAAAAYFSMQSARDPVAIPLQATQTAEMRQQATALATPLPGGPTFTVTNQLLRPVRVYVDGALAGEAPAQGQAVFGLTSLPGRVAWEVDRFPSPAGVLQGHEMRGEFAAVAAGQELTIDNRSAGQPYFYPVISNRTGQACSIIVNMDWSSEFITGVTIPAHTDNLPLGYFKLFDNSNVTLDCPESYFWWGLRPDKTGDESFASQVEPGTGRIELIHEP